MIRTINHVECLILLNACGLSSARRLKEYLDVFGSLAAIIEAPEADILKISGSNSRLAQKLRVYAGNNFLETEMNSIQKNGVSVLTIDDERYPDALKMIYDPPTVLYLKGHLNPADANSLAVVGSRHASHYGLASARKISRKLASMGLTIISGLARGIDRAAHEGALDAGGRTIAVLGSGLADLYPREHKALAEKIAANGAILSTFKMYEPPDRYNFPNRNRIISGLSQGVFVVEAAKRSGALITARFGLEQGKDVFALPGRVDSAVAGGTNALIKEGALLTVSAEDIYQEIQNRLSPAPGHNLHPLSKEPKESTEINNITDCDKKIYDVFLAAPDTPKHIDQIIQSCGLPAPAVHNALMHLTLKSLIRELPGRRYIARP